MCVHLKKLKSGTSGNTLQISKTFGKTLVLAVNDNNRISRIKLSQEQAREISNTISEAFNIDSNGKS